LLLAARRISSTRLSDSSDAFYLFLLFLAESQGVALPLAEVVLPLVVSGPGEAVAVHHHQVAMFKLKGKEG
jgi:hypothetical protein